ncbi:hypothetical protein GQ457_02G041460 [Hibiscus cannabinus]
MSSAANLRDPSAGNDLTYPGGRPPDNVPTIPDSVIRERSVSPLRVGDDRMMKKGRTKGFLPMGNIEKQGTDVETNFDTVIVDVEANSATINEPLKDSYASKVKDSLAAAKSPPSFLKDEVTFLDGDIITDCTGKIPSIQFSNRIHDQIDNNLSNAIIVRLLGRNIGYRALVNRVTALWKPIGSLHIIDLDNNYFLVRFSDPNDYSKVLTEGPWTIYGSYLTVQPWSRQFTTTEKHPTQLIGRVVRIDYNTDIGGRGKFARLAIVVDLNKPLLSCIRIDERVQTIEYEGLNQICFECGIYGHHKDVCKANTTGVEKMHGNAKAQDSTDKNTDVAISESSLFGPWMVVADRRRRGGTARSGGLTNVKPRSGSMFESLVVEDIGEDKDNDGSQELIVRTEDTMVAEGDNAERVSKVLIHTVTKNAAYRESNPSRKFKLDTRGNKSLGSKKDMDGAVQIIEHDTGLKIGDHKAISVIEDDFHDTSRSRGAGQRKKTNLGKGIVDVSRSKLLLRRNHGGRNADSIPIMDFTSRLSSDLDMIHTHDGSSGSRAGGHLIDHEAMLQSSDEDASYRSDSHEVLPEGAMFADD